jgi:hypothetical protein
MEFIHAWKITGNAKEGRKRQTPAGRMAAREETTVAMAASESHFFYPKTLKRKVLSIHPHHKIISPAVFSKIRGK